MNTSSVMNQTVTNVSGATALVSASTSKTASIIQDSAQANAPEVIQTAQDLMTTSDLIAVISVIVLVLSFLWNVYSTRRRNNISMMNYKLEREKFEESKKNPHC